MKGVLTVILIICAVVLNAQTAIRPKLLEVTTNKTTSLIFPAAINSIDRGSEKIVVQKSTTNVLRVKADSLFSDTTNLTVITVDGKLYSFLVVFKLSPSLLTVDLGTDGNADRDTALFALATTSMQMRNYLHGIRFSSGNVRLSLTGIFTNSSVLICKLRIENSSSLSFETGRIRAWVTGSQKGKRRSAQDKETDILLMQQECPVIREKQSCLLAVVLPKAALAPGQALQVEVHEKGGERHLTILIPNRHIINATLLK